MNKKDIEKELKHLQEKQYEITYYASMQDQIKHLHEMVGKILVALKNVVELIEEK